MKTVKKQGLTAQQKKYLRFRIIQYYLFAVTIKRTKKRTFSSDEQLLKTIEAKSKKVRQEIDKELTSESKFKFHIKLPSHLEHRAVKALVVAFAIMVLVVIGQLLYPSNRALPLSRLESAGYLGFADKDTILSNFENFDSRVVTVHTHTKSLTTSYKDLGVTIKPFETVELMTDYSIRERLVPFSILVKGNKNFAISRSLDEAQLKLFVDNVIAQASKQPKDAEVSLKGTQLIVKEAEDGHEYQAETLKSRVLKADLSDRGQIIFTPTILTPDIKTDDARFITARMQQRIDTPLLINAEGKTRRIEPATLASWIDIVPKPQDKTVDVLFNKKRVDSSLHSFIGDVNYNPTPTVVTYLNGVQAGRVEGSVGKILNYDDLLNRVTSNTSPLTSTLEALVTTTQPPEVIDRKYTKDSQGLQTLLSYWSSVNAGTYSIDFRTLDGNIKANLNPHRLMPSVGVYQTYIASLIYGKVTAGTISLNTATSAGKSVELCLDLMMRESNEACINALGSLVNWGASDSLLKAQGFGSTTLAQGASLTTANDLSVWAQKLIGGNLTASWHADTLTNIMSRNVYRTGIPAGSSGMLVANTFGSYGRSTNEIAVAYHPNGTYVLSILSEGSSPGLFANLASEINKVMNQ